MEGELKEDTAPGKFGKVTTGVGYNESAASINTDLSKIKFLHFPSAPSLASHSSNGSELVKTSTTETSFQKDSSSVCIEGDECKSTTLSENRYPDQRPRSSQYRSAPYDSIKYPCEKSLVWLFLSSVLYSLLAVIVCIPAWILLVVAIPLGCAFKNVSRCCYKPCDCSDDTEHISFSDVFYTQMTCQLANQAVIVIEGGLTVTQIKELINERWIEARDENESRLYPRFVQKLSKHFCGYVWTVDNFAMADHIFQIEVTIQDECDLKKYIGRMSSCVLPLNKPLWEIHVLNSYGPDDDTVLLFRFHPVMSDGVTLLNIIQQTMCDDYSPSCLQPSYGSRLLNNISVMHALFVSPLVFVEILCRKQSPDNPLRDQPSSEEKIVTWSPEINFSLVLRAKSASRCTVNDIFLSLSTSALRQFLQTRGIQNPYNISATMPVCMRHSSSGLDMGCEQTEISVPLVTNTEGLIPQVWHTKLVTNKVKHSDETLVIYCVRKIAGVILPDYFCCKLKEYIGRGDTCTLTNLAGPEQMVLFASRRVKTLLCWSPPRAHQALSMSLVTYGNSLYVTMMADKAVLPDLQILANTINEKMNALIDRLAFRRMRITQQIADDLSVMSSELTQGVPDVMDEGVIDEIQLNVPTVRRHMLDLKARLSKISADTPENRRQMEELRIELRQLLSQLRHQDQPTPDEVEILKFLNSMN